MDTKWYSAALKAAEKLPQNFGTAEQFKALLSKYGAKASELNYLKVPSFLDQFGTGRVPKSALVDYIDKNKVLPTEVVHSGDAFNSGLTDLSKDENFWNNTIANRGWAGVTSRAKKFSEYSPDERGQLLADIANQGYSNVPWLDNLTYGKDTRYSDYATHPDSNYKETLVTLPQKHDPVALNKAAMDSYGTTWDQLPDYRRDLIINSTDKSRFGPLYQSSHWDEPNVLFHLRTSSPLHDDPAMGYQPFLEELQSDWGQAGRKSGFKTPFPESERNSMYAQGKTADNAKLEALRELNHYLAGYDESDIKSWPSIARPVEEWVGLEGLPDEIRQAAKRYVENGALADSIKADYNKRFDLATNGLNPAPLVTNTNDWASAGIRRWLLDAAQQDAPSLAWTTGAQQSARYQGHAPEGMSGFYDKMVPNILNKYLKPYGGQVTLAPTLPNTAGMSTGAANRMLLDSDPHTATFPEALRAKLRDEGIPFFKKGGLLDEYATVI